MKKISLLSFVVIAVIVFSYCSPSKNATASAMKTTAVNYETNIAPIVATNCAPCHFPDKGGNKKPLDSYNTVNSQIDDILRRIQLNPSEKGFMPNRHAKLSDSTITVFKQWKTQGLLAK